MTWFISVQASWSYCTHWYFKNYQFLICVHLKKKDLLLRSPLLFGLILISSVCKEKQFATVRFQTQTHRDSKSNKNLSPYIYLSHTSTLLPPSPSSLHTFSPSSVWTRSSHLFQFDTNKQWKLLCTEVPRSQQSSPVKITRPRPFCWSHMQPVTSELSVSASETFDMWHNTYVRRSK